MLILDFDYLYMWVKMFRVIIIIKRMEKEDIIFKLVDGKNVRKKLIWKNIRMEKKWNREKNRINKK